MRSEVDADRIRTFIQQLGRRVRGPGTVFLTGGATALLFGWRRSTLDIDISMDLEPQGIFEAISRLKEDLDLNIELASPADFLPRLPGWLDRCIFIESVNEVHFFHYDPYSQALSKIERGHRRDLADVREMVHRGLVALKELRALFMQIEPDLIRFPAVDPEDLRSKLDEFVTGLTPPEDSP